MFLSQQQEQESLAVHDTVEQSGTADRAEEEPDGMTAANDSPTSDSELKNIELKHDMQPLYLVP